MQNAATLVGIDIVCLVGALLLKLSDEWSVRRALYMTLETIAPISKGDIKSLAAAASCSSRPVPNIALAISPNYSTRRDTVSFGIGTHSTGHTKFTQNYKKTDNLRAVQLLMGHTKMDSTVSRNNS